MRSKPLIVVLATVTLLASACGAETSSERAPEVGRIAPPFSLERLDGGQLDLDTLRGKVVMINFWASWCGPCRVEMPLIQQAYDRYRDEGFEVVGVDFGEPKSDALDFVQAGAFTWPFVLDPDQEIARAYQVLGLPTSVFLDRDGVIRQIHRGPIVRLEQVIDPVKELL